ncbi:MAG: efflux RND transporter periplasmic adaptor subunit [Acidobacteriia bacterium]|nr:efflux RND transporter periplasmic adaptor subunit [Terriglobia bacterium]
MVKSIQSQSFSEDTAGNRRKWRPGGSILALLFLLAAFLPAAACSKKEAAAERAASAPRPAVPVTVASVVQKTIPVELHAIGAGEAYSTVAVKSMINGEITKVNFTQGQFVKKGELLFKIDSRPYEAALKQAEANLARDLAQQKNAEEEARRSANLYAQGIVPQQQADQMKANADALAASAGADRAAIENVKVQLSYCSIYSPIEGRTGSLLIYPGNVVKANDTTSLVIINQITPLFVTFSVPEQYLTEIKSRIGAGRMEVRVSIPGTAGNPIRGALSFIDNTVDSNTGTIRLKATFPNGDHQLWPGQFVNVILQLSSQPNTVVVPTPAIQTSQSGSFVFVVKDDLTVESRPVVVGRVLDGETSIDKGLEPGERVVTDGQLRLSPGAKVQIKSGV